MVLSCVAHLPKICVEDSLKGYNICVTWIGMIHVIRLSWAVKLMVISRMITMPTLSLMHDPPI